MQEPGDTGIWVFNLEGLRARVLLEAIGNILVMAAFRVLAAGLPEMDRFGLACWLLAGPFTTPPRTSYQLFFRKVWRPAGFVEDK